MEANEKEALAALRKACENTGAYRACERSVDWLEKIIKTTHRGQRTLEAGREGSKTMAGVNGKETFADLRKATKRKTK